MLCICRKGRAFDFHPDVGLVIAGGYNGTEMDIVEMSRRGQDLGRKFEKLPNLPKQLEESCLVIINSTTIFVAGGNDGDFMHIPLDSKSIMYTFLVQLSPKTF